MAGEYYRALRPRVTVGLLRSEIDPLLAAAGAPDWALAVVTAHTEPEPYNVTHSDAGIAEDETPDILVLGPTAIQIDGGLNEIPKATCAFPIGRDATSSFLGSSDDLTLHPAQVVEFYVPAAAAVTCRIYLRVDEEDRAEDDGVDDSWPDENLLFFDGIFMGPGRRVDGGSARLVFHLTHALSRLTYSSSATADIAGGSEYPQSFSAIYPGAALAGDAPVLTPYGAGLVTVALGEGLRTDFWGFRRPAVGRTSDQYGVQGFLDNLTSMSVMNWAAFTQAADGSRICAAKPASAVNSGAQEGLARLEPFGPEFAEDPATIGADWQAVGDAVTVAQDLNAGTGVSRADIIAIDPEALAAVGYRYSVPLSFYIDLQRQAPGAGLWTYGASFANDLTTLTFSNLVPLSIWDLIANQYASRFQFAIAPNASGAAIVPFQPVLDRAWVNIEASDATSWEDDRSDPAPLRGVVLTSPRKSYTGDINSGVNLAAPGAAAAFQQMDSVFDSCGVGGFLFRQAPVWMTSAGVAPPNTAIVSGVVGGRVPASVPGKMKEIAYQKLVDQLLAASSTDNLSDALAAMKIPDIDALAAPTTPMRQTAYRYARALYQQERLRHRSLYVRGRLRVDVAPGSIVNVAVPQDYFVDAATEEQRCTGMVVRVTHIIDANSLTAATHLHVGFVRTYAETLPETPSGANPLYADAHPFWATVCYGTPWCDSLAMRARLGDKDTLTP